MTELPTPPLGSWWAELVVDDGGDVSMFGMSSVSEVWRATSSEDWEAQLLGVDAGWITRVEIVGSTPHVWFGDRHATTSADGNWFEETTLGVEGMPTAAVGLDGAGGQLVYAFDEWSDTTDLWTFDGTSTVLVGEVPGWTVMPVPTAHPTDPSHEHAAVIGSDWGFGFVWPTRESEAMVISASPCSKPNNVVSARTTDGRIWIAWIVTVLPMYCEGDAPMEDGMLRMVEIDPEHELPREVLRLGLDTENLATERGYVLFDAFDIYDGALSMAAFGQQLVLTVADGPEESRVRVMSFDTSR